MTTLVCWHTGTDVADDPTVEVEDMTEADALHAAEEYRGLGYEVAILRDEVWP